MSEPLTESQVARVVAEVTRQAQLRELNDRQGLEREQVVQILEELNLPVELLDPAMQELQRREAEAEALSAYEKALATQRRRKFWIIGSCLAALLVIIIFVAVYVQRHTRAIAGIAAVEPGRITRAADDGGELVYRVSLGNVPIAENLSMKCNWTDPSGRVVKQNSWQTRTTDKAVWSTFCRNTLGSSAQAGTWRVEMLLEDRVVSRTDFRVE